MVHKIQGSGTETKCVGMRMVWVVDGGYTAASRSPMFVTLDTMLSVLFTRVVRHVGGWKYVLTRKRQKMRAVCRPNTWTIDQQAILIPFDIFMSRVGVVCRGNNSDAGLPRPPTCNLNKWRSTSYPIPCRARVYRTAPAVSRRRIVVAEVFCTVER